YKREGGKLGAVVAMHDVTERKQAEEALRKNKEERLFELERVRARIATDLHDDIGASLTRIVVLSEVVQQSIERAATPVSEQLASITNVSNELVEAMSDIVWAINPRKDHLSDLTLRMRRLASDLLTARQIAFSFRAPGVDEDVPLGANVRREVFLIFKESLNNLVKHSDCTQAAIEFQIGGEWLTLTLGDDGRGFDPVLASATESRSRSRGGNGLASMRRRAQEMGGELEIISGRGAGTTVKLRIPTGAQLHGNGENPHPLGR
ncbi:MAG: sensor histidine kinase, partial [Pyrinomonadaceae bacterium]